jgi:3-hydroxyisobutyrate dehydrogenase-like beta-hydroxyacid dehydrogenase
VTTTVGRRVGAIGLGLLGSALTATLLERGFEVQGFDLDSERLREHEQRGGHAAGSIREAVQGTDRLLLCLPTSEISREVCLGAGGVAEAAEASMVVMDATTARPSDSVAIGSELAERGVSYLDTTISGSSAMARHRDIVVMVGGPRTPWTGPVRCSRHWPARSGTSAVPAPARRPSSSST